MLVDFLSPDLRRLDEHWSEAMCLPVFAGERPLRGTLGLVDWRLCGRITELVQQSRLHGRVGETLLMPGRPRLNFEKLFLVGAGSPTEMSDSAYCQVVRNARTVLDKAQVHECVFVLPIPLNASIPAERAMELFVSVESEFAHPTRFTIVGDSGTAKVMSTALERVRRSLAATGRV